MTSFPGNSISGMPHALLPAHAQLVLIPHLRDSVYAHLTRPDIIQCLRVCQSWSEAFKPYLWNRLDLSDYQLFHRFITSAVVPDDEDPATEALKQLSKDALLHNKQAGLEQQIRTPHSLASTLKTQAIQTGSPLAWMEYSYYLAMPASVSNTLGANHTQSLLALLRMPHGTIRNSGLIESLQVEFHSRLSPCSIMGSPSEILMTDALTSAIPPLPVLVPGVHTMDFHQDDNAWGAKDLGVMDKGTGAMLEQLSSLSLLPASHQQSAFMSFLSQCENLVRLSLVCVGSEAVADNLAFYCPLLEELELKCRRKSGLATTTTTSGGGKGAKTGSKDYNFHCSDRAIARLILSATSFAGLLHDDDLDSLAFVVQGQGGPPERQLKKFAVDNVDRFGPKSIEALVQAHPRLEALSIKNCQSVKSDHWHLLLSSLACLREADFQSEGEHDGHKSARAQTGLREWSSGIPQFIPVVQVESLLAGGETGGASGGRPLNLASLSKAQWICGATLRVLKLGISNFSYSYPHEILPLLEQDQPAPEANGVYTWLFSHLAGLEQLQELWLSDHLLDHGHRSRTSNRQGAGSSYNEPVVGSVTFHLTLASGLDMLAGLKRLRVLDVSDLDHQIGLLEVEWMVANWPRLSVMRGLVATVWQGHGHISGHSEKINAAARAAAAINWLSQCHPHIQLE
ncbi:hypothetical protein BGZ74_002968 [Mortierella antarctica]|nr:hypothetical protein BGZ74_002968 [Mortierella antarctica]